MMKLLVTSGRGPAECRIAVAKVLERLQQEAADVGCVCDVATSGDHDGHGPASAMVVVSSLIGPEPAKALAARWLGSILWVAPSPVRPHHKRKNWFIGVAELAMPDVPTVRIAAASLRFEAMRAGGPGGQHQNKTESAVRAVHVASGLAVVVRDERLQSRNKALALERLQALLDAKAAHTALQQKNAMQALHDRIERGQPVRTFRGVAFEER